VGNGRNCNILNSSYCISRNSYPDGAGSATGCGIKPGLDDENNRNSLHQYQKNFVPQFSKAKDVIPLLFMRAGKQVLRIISDLHTIVTKRIEPVRPRRKYPRNSTIKPDGSVMITNPYAKVIDIVLTGHY
jgi:hypothetical protein